MEKRYYCPWSLPEHPALRLWFPESHKLNRGMDDQIQQGDMTWQEEPHRLLISDDQDWALSSLTP